MYMYMVNVNIISAEMIHYFSTEEEAKAFAFGVKLGAAGTKDETRIRITITKEETSDE